ncbi:MAG: hypothetical protein E6K78_03925 [Candidatus Eisenbacteria bacterium]|uniref:DUF3108 domain-containing protein n=1 Tax=Eiseniibacteriota bacterium TaxID=2212470 RepID=A0A538TVM0_UNCEI|nr:MAG: hypothetical protein E6K78_03925 [Candidatus Eisenbacteria bacterium]
MLRFGVMRPICHCLPFALLILMPLPLAAQDGNKVSIDHGNFIVSKGDRNVGAETFSIEARFDSVIVESRFYGKERTPDGEEPLEKELFMLLSRGDYALRKYQSTALFLGQKLTRGIVPGDTSMTLYREDGRGGSGDRVATPPGRLFIFDARLFVLFDLICLNLHGQSFESRPISVLALAQRDSMFELTATRLGAETIRWGARPVQAGRLSLSDGTTTFLVWTDPDGKMLRLENRESGTRVEREPPPVKRRAAPPKG